MLFEVEYSSALGCITAAELIFSRSLGGAGRVLADLPIKRNTTSSIERGLAKTIEDGCLSINITLRDGENVLPLSAPAMIEKTEWAGASSYADKYDSLLLSGVIAASNSLQDSFIPRRRVLRAATMAELLEQLSHVALAPPPILNEADRINLRSVGGQKCGFIIQDGLSDWDLLLEAIGQCNLLAASGVGTLNLVLTGNIAPSENDEGKWLIAAGSKTTLEQCESIEDRLLKVEADPETARIRMGFSASASERTEEYKSGSVPVVSRRWLHREFSPSLWNEWISRSLPLFTGDSRALIIGIKDRLYHPGNGEGISWETTIETVPEKTVVAPVAKGKSGKTWMGTGEVVERSPEGPWIGVRLFGFEGGSDVIQSRLGTPLSGSNGQRGLNWIPALNTEALVTWSGKFNETAICIGNVRSQKSELPAPSLWLEEGGVYNVAPSQFKKLEKVSIDCAATVEIAQALNLAANGAKVELRDGTVYTGRG